MRKEIKETQGKLNTFMNNSTQEKVFEKFEFGATILEIF